MKDIELMVGEEPRTITTTNVSWLLASGWMFYVGSLLLNLVYYLMHPSSPEMWTWGAEEELEIWIPELEAPEEQNIELKTQLDRSNDTSVRHILNRLSCFQKDHLETSDD